MIDPPVMAPALSQNRHTEDFRDPQLVRIRYTIVPTYAAEQWDDGTD